jgi:4-amino-4-deoxy-L-arabinose transferase-like glycosyltransferase/Tfp pilus assembly protein PilF
MSRRRHRFTREPVEQPARVRWSLPALLVVAFAIKAAVLAQLGGHPLLQPHGELDTAYYVDLARRVADGGPLAIREAFYLSPLYVFFLAAIFALGGSLFAARLAQILLGTAAVSLLYGTSRQWFGERCAWVAASLAILTGLFTFYEILVLQSALDPFLTACTLFAISRAQADERPRWLVLAGVTGGLFTLNRPNALAYLLAAVIGIVLVAGRNANSRRAAVAGAARRGSLLLVSALVVLVPNAIRNYAVSGEAILISSHGGLNFYIGNNAGADGTYQRIAGITPSVVGQTRDATRLAEAESGRRLSSGDVSDYFYRRAWEWIKGNPPSALALLARKVALIANAANAPLNYSYAYYSRDENTLLRFLLVGPWLIVPLGLVGLFMKSMRRQSRGFWVWASFVPVYGLSVAVFFVSSRYRMPLLLPLCASSAATIVRVVDGLRRRRPAALVAPGAALIVCGVLVNWNLGVDDGRGTERTRRAVWLVEQGAYDEARRYVDSISADHSHRGVLRFRVGDALAAAGRYDEAIERYQQALEIDKGQPAIHLAMGQALTVRDRALEALPHLRTAFEARYQTGIAATWLLRALVISGSKAEAARLLANLPGELGEHQATTAADLGSIALEMGEAAQAERWLSIAVTQKPDDAELQEQLGIALLMLGRASEAIAPLEAACRQDPAGVGPRLNLAVADAQLGRMEDARRNAEHALLLDPHDARVLDLLKRLGRK